MVKWPIERILNKIIEIYLFIYYLLLSTLFIYILLNYLIIFSLTSIGKKNQEIQNSQSICLSFVLTQNRYLVAVLTQSVPLFHSTFHRKNPRIIYVFSQSYASEKINLKTQKYP